mgnify:CR=1 FL=1
MRQKKLRKVFAIALAVTMMISGVNFNHIVRADETESSTTEITIPTLKLLIMAHIREFMC